MKWDWAASQADRADLDRVDCQCSESHGMIKERGSLKDELRPCWQQGVWTESLNSHTKVYLFVVHESCFLGKTNSSFQGSQSNPYS